MLELGDFTLPGHKITMAGHERVAGLRATVHDDGAAALFAVQFTNQHPFKVLIPFHEMPAIMNEFRVAAGVMTARAAEAPDQGHMRMLELCSAALRPHYVDGMIERLSGDRIYLMQFEDHAPVAIRISADMAFRLRQKMDRLARLASH